MRLTIHITFYYNESRLGYLNQVLQFIDAYPHHCDVFVHTNAAKFTTDPLYKNSNGTTVIVPHDLGTESGFYLTWKCRDLMKSQLPDYDAFVYLEDDIGMPGEALAYWLQHKDICTRNGYNLGFLRVERGRDSSALFVTDLNKPMTRRLSIDGAEFVLNDVNPYCGFWIYDRDTFRAFTESPYYEVARIAGYGIREKSAIGLHGVRTPFYKGTVLPMKEGSVDPGCKVYHLPNNYIGHPAFATIPIHKIVV